MIRWKNNSVSAVIAGSLELRRFFAECFQFGQGFEVVGAARCAFGADQLFETEALCGAGNDAEFHAGGYQILVGSTAGHFTQEVDEAQGSFQSKVQTARQGYPIPKERECGGSASEIWIEVPECGH